MTEDRKMALIACAVVALVLVACLVWKDWGPLFAILGGGLGGTITGSLHVWYRRRQRRERSEAMKNQSEGES